MNRIKVYVELKHKNIKCNFTETEFSLVEQNNLKVSDFSKEFRLDFLSAVALKQPSNRDHNHNKGGTSGFPPRERASGLTRSLGFSIRPDRGGTHALRL